MLEARRPRSPEEKKLLDSLDMSRLLGEIRDREIVEERSAQQQKTSQQNHRLASVYEKWGIPYRDALELLTLQGKKAETPFVLGEQDADRLEELTKLHSATLEKINAASPLELILRSK